MIVAGSPSSIGFGPIAIAVNANDQGAAGWLAEFLPPWFASTSQAPEWRVRVWSCRDTYARLAAARPIDAALHPCFAFHQQVLSLPAWRDRDRLIVEDAERSCFLSLAPFDVEVTGDPETRRWRFTAMWVLVEIAATRLRQTALDLHAAAIERNGAAIVIAGPKGTGKTTLSLHLLRSGLCRWIANDRAFLSHVDGSLLVRGVPTALKVRPQTLAEFPGLPDGLSHVSRPYLYTTAELTRLPGASLEAPIGADPIAFSPAQVVRQLGVCAVPAAPLRAILFPRIQPGINGWSAERLDPPSIRAEICSNLYAVRSAACAPTLFEQTDGGPVPPSADLVSRVSEGGIPAYRLTLGATAYREPGFAGRLLSLVADS